MKILNKGTDKENFATTSFLTKTGISEEINRGKHKETRYINLFEITSMYNTYKRGFLTKTRNGDISLSENCYIGRAQGREQLAYYHKLITGEKEKFLNYEDLPIEVVTQEEFKELEKNKLFGKEIRKNEMLYETYRTWQQERIIITNDRKIITIDKKIKKNGHELFEKYSLTKEEKEIIKKIVKSPEEERNQLLLNLLFFSYHFPILNFEDLKNENYLILVFLLKTKNVDKPQMKIRNHTNLPLMYELIKWVDQQRIKDYKAFIELDLIDVLNKLTEDNLYFLQMYLLHGNKEFFNINKYKDRTLFAEAVSKFMTLTSYKFKEQLALNFNYVKIVNSFLKGTKRNELIREIKLAKISSENRKEAALKRKKENEIKRAERLENSNPETITTKIKTALKEGKNIHEILRKLELPVYNYDSKKDLTIVSLKKERGKSIIAKALEGSWIQVAKTQREINVAGSKASCCLHEGGMLKELARWINDNKHMACLYGKINEKNFQILAYLKINLNPYRRTVVFDNIEANEKLTNAEYNSLLKEIKTKMRAYGLHVGIIRSDVEKFSLANRPLIRDSINKRKNMGITDETYYFHDSLEYIEEKKAVAFEIKKNLIVRKGELSDLFQLTQLEKNTYGDYDSENTYVTEFINGNEEINVITDEDSNIYGYSIVRKIKTCADLTDHVRNPEIVLKIDKIKRMGIKEVNELIEKQTKEYTYIEDFNVIKELRKSKIVYDLARNTVDSIKKMSKDNKVHFHSNENSKHMEHFLLRKGFEAFNLGDIEKKEKKARRKAS